MKITLPYSQDTYDLRDPKGKDLRALADAIQGKGLSEIEQVYVLICQLASPSLTLDALDEMDAEDVTALMSAIKSQRAFNAGR